MVVAQAQRLQKLLGEHLARRYGIEFPAHVILLLNAHVHFHCVVVDGVFEADGEGSVGFHEARGIGPATIAEIQAQVRHRLLSVLARRGVLEREDAEAMGTWGLRRGLVSLSGRDKSWAKA